MTSLPSSAGVIGWPVAHSKSPLIHRFWLAKLGLDGDYGRFPVHPDKLGEAIRALPALGLRGVNVTVPHKVAVMAHLDSIDNVAEEVGAVNTITIVDGRRHGHNTDVAGFLEPLKRYPDWSTPSTYVGLIGTGGAARAVATALRGHVVDIYGRDDAKVEAMVDEFGFGGARLSDLAGPARADEKYATTLLVNASTLGMVGNPPVEIDLDGYATETIVYDLVYAPLETSLLAAARARGMRTIDGLAMLISQAAAAFELFYDASAPRQHDAELRALLTA